MSWLTDLQTAPLPKFTDEAGLFYSYCCFAYSALAQYWRSVWLELEPRMCLRLAQAFAPRGRKHDFKDAERLVRRLMANELILSFAPSGVAHRLHAASV